MASTKYVLRTYLKPPSDPLSSAFNWIELDRRLWSHEAAAAAEDEGEGESHSILSSHLPLQFPSPEEQNRTVTLVYQVIGLNDSGSSSIPSVLQPLLSTKPRSIDRSDKQTKPHAEHVYLNWIECISYIIIKHKLWQACDWSMSNWIHRNFHLHQHSPPSIHCRSSPHSHGGCARDRSQRDQPAGRSHLHIIFYLHSIDFSCLLVSDRVQRWMDGWVNRGSDVITSNWFIIWRNDRVICLTIDLLFINVNLCIHYCAFRSLTHLWLISSSCSCAAPCSSSDSVGIEIDIRLGSDWSPSLSRPVGECCCGKCRASCHCWSPRKPARFDVADGGGDAAAAPVCSACIRAWDPESHCYPPPWKERKRVK